jgi:hypothetical protein
VPDPNGKFPELKIGSTDLLGLTAQPHILNIHLYSQALTATKTMVMTGKAHIDYINEMLQYGPNKAPFDLAVNNKEPDHIELGGEPVPPDLSQTDLTALYEFGAPINPSKNFLLTDPAECLQGWAS